MFNTTQLGTAGRSCVTTTKTATTTICSSTTFLVIRFYGTNVAGLLLDFTAMYTFMLSLFAVDSRRVQGRVVIAKRQSMFILYR